VNKPFEILKGADVTIVEQVDLPARIERRAPIPPTFAASSAGGWLAAVLGESGLWSHQALAIEATCRGENVVLATATASGKTLPFMATAMWHLLTGDTTVLAFYTSKALASDQLERWREAAKAAGLPDNSVAELTGDTLPGERMDILAHARVILATPDVWQAWAMAQVSSSQMRAFLARLALVILDEAHCYEHVFGSNQALLLRRIRAACNRARASKASAPLQFVAATATIDEPARHLERLTGLPFTAITESDNGAPSAGAKLLHVEGPDHGAPSEAFIVGLLEDLIPRIGNDTIIVFDDGRQRVERIARKLKRDDVFAYRGGYEMADRKRIEAALRQGKCRVIVSTSALELGIDVPHFVIGLLVGLPTTKKQFRQRVGRVGRMSAGVCALIAPATAFSQFGSSLADYWNSSVEPSHLYLDNPYVQFGQARCLLDECEAQGGQPILPDDINWPEGFSETFALAQPGARRPRHFDAVALVGANAPHYNYPLRQIGETRFDLRCPSAGGERFGTITHRQALKEAFPGATYLHAGLSYYVRDWRTFGHERTIRLDPIKHAARKDPIIFKSVSLSVADDGLVEGCLMGSDTGLLAEVQLQVTESVEGYRIGNNSIYYRELREQNPAMTRKQFEFSTTGILIQIDEPWFSGKGGVAQGNRQAVGEALRHMLMHERSVSGAEVDFAESNIAWWQPEGPRGRTDCLVVYDTVSGGLRLTESLFSQLPHYLERLALAGDLAGGEALLSATLVERLQAWLANLEERKSADVPSLTVAREGEDYLIYAPGSEVAVMHDGILAPRTIMEPQIMSFGEGDHLMYRYEAGNGVNAFVAHDRIHTPGHNWRRALWNPQTNVIRELGQ
jgi:DEAD/DEAH box helicase domain-containing protein